MLELPCYTMILYHNGLLILTHSETLQPLAVATSADEVQFTVFLRHFSCTLTLSDGSLGH